MRRTKQGWADKEQEAGGWAEAEENTKRDTPSLRGQEPIMATENNPRVLLFWA